MPGILTGTIIGLAQRARRNCAAAADRHGRLRAQLSRGPAGFLDPSTALPSRSTCGPTCRTRPSSSARRRHHRPAGIPDRDERHRHSPAPSLRAALVTECGDSNMNMLNVMESIETEVNGEVPMLKIVKMRGDKVSSMAQKQALFDVDLDILDKNQVTALIGPSGCGKSTFLRCLNRMNDTIDDLPGHRQDHARQRGHLRPHRRRGRTARAGRHGVPEAEPVPQVDLRQRCLWPAHPWTGAFQGRSRRSRREEPPEGGTL